jgi:hypothetical protein
MFVNTEQLGFHWTDFDETFYSNFFFSKICLENSSFIKIRQEERVLYMKTFSHLWQYLAKFFLEEKFLDKSYRENQNTRFMFNKFYQKIVPFMR